MTRLSLLVVLVLGGRLMADERPNIVVLFADDAGYADFGFQPKARSDMKRLTPNIDSIARDGVRLSAAYMSGAVCSPSRAGLMTGRYQQRFGHDNNIPPGYMKSGLPLSETFGAKRLKKTGYTTGLVGKWHLGYPAAFHPNKRGFDWFYGCLQGSRSYFPYTNKPTANRVLQENGRPTPEKGYVTDRLGDAACRFIAEHREEAFFLFVSFTAPHGPLQAKPEHLKRLAEIPAGRRRRYAGLVVSLDENVGKILECLGSNKLDHKTLVIFTNDNGGQTKTGANNQPLRGRKGQLWEGGVRVPCAMRWPGRIRAGSVIDDPVSSLDFLPTFLALAGTRPQPEWKLDGINLIPRLTGEVDALPERDLHWRGGGSKGPIAMRRGPWKMVHNRQFMGGRPQLFRLDRDLSETENLADDHPEMLAEMVKRASAWEAQLVEPLWGKGSPR
ncbi:MAG: sulfatase-like hydrolase/transferase [Planctomycetales bacterium]|nr:sulfatase-like hydrolase/transferase [Planctomycetales bacterium]